tara:strand:+ start:154 stop:375 length:222 start_codon:yes stop_codon:yes gene_type:complete
MQVVALGDSLAPEIDLDLMAIELYLIIAEQAHMEVLKTQEPQELVIIVKEVVISDLELVLTKILLAQDLHQVI